MSRAASKRPRCELQKNVGSHGQRIQVFIYIKKKCNIKIPLKQQFRHRDYCFALAGENLNGVIMKSDKRRLDGTLNPETVNAFFLDYLSQRKVKSGPGKGKNHMSAKSLECYSEALSNEKKNQVAHEPGRFVSDFEKT